MRQARAFLSALPFLIIGALLYAAFFVKPSARGNSLPPPVMSRGDVVYSVVVPAKGVLWAAGSDGKVWYSDDMAKTWRLQATPTSRTLQDIAAWDSSHAVVVGNRGVVLRTADGGRSWTEVIVPLARIANKLMRVRTFSDGEAWAVGEAGVVLHTGDYGVGWRRASPEEDSAWNDVQKVGSRVIVVGEFGRIRMSRNAGATWIDIQSPVKSSLMALAFKDQLSGLAVGLDGVVLKTGDGGVSWSHVPHPVREHLFDVIWERGRWVATGNKGVLVTGNAAATEWKASLVSKTDRAWHTRIVGTEAGYVTVGQKIDLIQAVSLTVGDTSRP